MARTQNKTRPALLDIDRAWLAAMPFCVMATASSTGECDASPRLASPRLASPKGDPSGRLVHVIDDRTVALAEVFFHCARAFMRSGLWDPSTWHPEDLVPRRAVVAHEVEPNGLTLEL